MDTVRGAAGVGEPFREIVDAEVIEDYQPRHADESETDDQYRLRSERYWEKGFRDQYRARHRGE